MIKNMNKQDMDNLVAAIDGAIASAGASKQDAATDAAVRYVAITRIFDTVCPVANVILAIACGALAFVAYSATFSGVLLIIGIVAGAMLGDALPAVAYGAATCQPAAAFENITGENIADIIDNTVA